jgi:hypothetical protein
MCGRLVSNSFLFKIDTCQNLGVLIKEMIQQGPPWPELRNIEAALSIIDKTLDLEIPQNIPVLSALLKDCFSYSPAERPSFGDICRRLEHLSTDESGNMYIYLCH